MRILFLRAFGTSSSSTSWWVRNPAYEWQEEDHLRQLFGANHVAAHLRRIVGFSIDEALKIADVVMHWVLEAIANGMNDAQPELEAFERLIAAHRAGEPPPAPTKEDARRITSLAQLPDDQLDKMAHAFMLILGWDRLGDRSSFTVEDIATAAHTDPNPPTAFLELVSQPFGQDAAADPMRALQAVRARPILRDRGRFHCVDGGALLWAIRPRIEEASKADESAFRRYEKHRASWCEGHVAGLLAGVLQPAELYRSLKWTSDGQAFELDSLVLVDRYVITIEVKAGAFSTPARRAAPERLDRDLRKLVADAHSQARRAREALTGGVAFTDGTGQQVTINPSRFQTVLPLVVTLDELAVSPRVWELARSGLLEPGEQHPTTMGVSDLEIVCDLLDTPARLLHYLTRRHTLNQIGGVSAMEEADLVMYYLDQGLYVEGDDTAALTILPSLTDPVDAYYLHKAGRRRRPAAKPSLRVHPTLEGIIRGLEQHRPGGWTMTACFILDLAGDEQQRLGKRIGTMRKRSRTKCVPHDISIAIDDSTRGLTVVTEPNGDHEQLAEYVRHSR